MNPLSIQKLDLNLWDLKNKKQLEFSEHHFNSFVRNKVKLNFKKTKCPCGTKKKPVLVKKVFDLSYYQCICKTIFLNPTISENNLDEIYKNNGIYEKHRRQILYEKKAKVLRNLINKRKASQILNLLKTHNLKILDFGCGDGDFLNHLNKKIKSEKLYGFDVNTSLKQQQKKIKIISETNELINQKFNVVTLWGVLEHVSDPKKLINFVSKIITKNGFLVLEIPSSESLLSKYTFQSKKIPIRWLEPYRHLFFFSLACIKKMFKKKFKIKYIETNGLDLQTIFDNEKSHNELKIINVQNKLNDNLLGDHYRIFLKKL